VPGGSPGFDPFMQSGGFAPQPYFVQPQPRPQPRPAVQQPRPQTSRPIPVAAISRPQDRVETQVYSLPPPEQLGIRLNDPAAATKLPPPEQLGIRLD
jgi:hypothetical protein